MPEQYSILGPDGREYGPVPIETIARWIEEGRIIPSTLVRKGDAAPADAGSYPEIAALFQARAGGAPPGQPSGPAAGAQPGAPPAIPAPLTVRPGTDDFRVWDLLDQSWTLVRPHWLPLAAMFFILSALASFPSVGGVVWFIVGGPIMVGIWRAILGMVDGRAPTVGMMFEGFDRFGDAFLAALIMKVLIALGFIALIVPGFILIILWIFTYPILGETRINFWEAMHQSAVLTEGYRWRLFLLALACLPVLFLGLLVLCVGVYLALPVCYTAFALAYRFLQRRKQAGAPA